MKIGGLPVKKVTTTRCLGMVSDDKLKLERHIYHMSKKISQAIGAINLIKPCVPKNCLNQICNALVKPYIDYCSLVQENCN